MKRLLLAPLLLALTSCGYASFYEANSACERWTRAGGKYEITIWDSSKVKVQKRRCYHEERTNQVLGKVKKGKVSFWTF